MSHYCATHPRLTELDRLIVGGQISPHDLAPVVPRGGVYKGGKAEMKLVQLDRENNPISEAKALSQHASAHLVNSTLGSIESYLMITKHGKTMTLDTEEVAVLVNWLYAIWPVTKKY